MTGSGYYYLYQYKHVVCIDISKKKKCLLTKYRNVLTKKFFFCYDFLFFTSLLKIEICLTKNGWGELNSKKMVLGMGVLFNCHHEKYFSFEESKYFFFLLHNICCRICIFKINYFCIENIYLKKKIMEKYGFNNLKSNWIKTNNLSPPSLLTNKSRIQFKTCYLKFI